MKIGKYDFSKTQVILAVLIILFIAYVIFNELRKASWKKKLEDAIKGIDLRVTSGKASASELVELNSKRKAILQQYLNSL